MANGHGGCEGLRHGAIDFAIQPEQKQHELLIPQILMQDHPSIPIQSPLQLSDPELTFAGPEPLFFVKRSVPNSTALQYYTIESLRITAHLNAFANVNPGLNSHLNFQVPVTNLYLVRYYITFHDLKWEL